MNKIGHWILILFGCLSSLAADVNHVVIYYSGQSEVGLIDSMNSGTIYLTRYSDSKSMEISLSNVYMAYDDQNRLFYVSPSFRDRIDQIEEYSGEVITLEGEHLPFQSFYWNRNFIKPEVFLTTAHDSVYSVALFDISKVELDFSTLNESVAKGFHRSAGLFLGLTAFETLGGWRQSLHHQKLISTAAAKNLGTNAWDNGQKLLPRADIAGIKTTGVRYHSMIISFTLFTAGQMAWDIWRGNRIHYFFPKTVDERFPRSMFHFSFKRWYKKQIAKAKTKLPDLPF